MRTVVLIAFLAVSSSCLAQFAWRMNFPGSGYTGAECLSIDANDNVLVIGNFENGVTIAGTIYTGRGSFLLKLSKNGDPIWHKIIRYGPGDFWSLFEVDTDADGNAYIGGVFSQSAMVDGTNLSSPDSYNSLVAKFNPAGELQWTKVLHNVQEFYDMNVNDAGNVLLYSHHYGTVTIDNLTLQVGTNSFGLMLDSSGAVVWGKALGDSQHYTTWPRACAIDNDGNAYFHGLFSGTLSLDGHQATSTGGNYNFFVTKINSAGVCQWITPMDRKIPNYETSNPPSGLIIERGALEVDLEGNLYLGGQYWEGIKVGSLSLSGGGSCLVKFSPAGDPLWLKSRPASSSSSTIDDIVLHNGLVYFSGIQPAQFYFSIYNASDGSMAAPEVMVPIMGDIASGLGVDSENKVYMSGREYTGATLQGFVFKYGMADPRPYPAAPVIGTATMCQSQNVVTFTTTPIVFAESYEWEIIVGGVRYTVVTDTPELSITLSDYDIEGNFSIRVRGKNTAGVGTYSVEKAVVIEKPLEAPVLVANCTRIHTTEDKEFSNLVWHLNDAEAEKYGEATSITPDEEGDYYVVVSNSCGTAPSNEIAFVPLKTSDIMIPNVITPNGDNDNQNFVVDEKLNSPALTIYNRWGQPVYATDKYVNTWDGNNLVEGVYYYKMSSGCLSESIKGTITIAR